MSIGDAVNTGLLVAAVLGIAMTLWQVRVGVRTKRGEFLKDLYSTLVSDADIGEAYYLIEYGRFDYGRDFHGSTLEPKVDRLLGFVDLVAELRLQAVLSDREMAFFRYRFKRVYEDPGVQGYLAFLSSFYAQVGVAKEPFHSFQKVARLLTADESAVR